MSKRRKPSGEMLLPLYRNHNEEKSNSKDDELVEWTSWDTDECVDNNKAQTQNNYSNSSTNSRRNSKSDDSKKKDDDIFKELEPTILKTKKYFIGEKINPSKFNPKPKTFNYSSDIIGQLGSLEDESGWEIGDVKLTDDNRNVSWAY